MQCHFSWLILVVLLWCLMEGELEAEGRIIGLAQFLPPAALTCSPSFEDLKAMIENFINIFMLYKKDIQGA